MSNEECWPILPNFKRLNELLDSNLGFHLHVTASRYGYGLVAFLAEGNDSSEKMANNCSDGDMDHARLMEYFDCNNWYPFVCGDDAAEALSKLVGRINSIDDKDYETWKKAVALASNHYLGTAQENRETKLPDFEEYVRIKREETYFL